MSHRRRSRVRRSVIGLVASALTGFVVIGAAWAQVPNVTIGGSSTFIPLLNTGEIDFATRP